MVKVRVSSVVRVRVSSVVKVWVSCVVKVRVMFKNRFYDFVTVPATLQSCLQGKIHNKKCQPAVNYHTPSSTVITVPFR